MGCTTKSGSACSTSGEASSARRSPAPGDPRRVHRAEVARGQILLDTGIVAPVYGNEIRLRRRVFEADDDAACGDLLFARRREGRMRIPGAAVPFCLRLHFLRRAPEDDKAFDARRQNAGQQTHPLYERHPENLTYLPLALYTHTPHQAIDGGRPHGP